MKLFQELELGLQKLTVFLFFFLFFFHRTVYLNMGYVG